MNKLVRRFCGAWIGLLIFCAGAQQFPIIYPQNFPAPFDFHWGHNRLEIPAHYQLTCTTLEHGERCQTQRLRLGGRNEFYFTLYFHHDLGLVRMIYHEDIPPGDFNGTVGKERFSYLRDELLAEYPDDKIDEYFSMFNKHYFNERTEFYQCLHNKDCGAFITFIDAADEGRIIIEIEGFARGGTGRINIVYESSFWLSFGGPVYYNEATPPTQ